MEGKREGKEGVRERGGRGKGKGGESVPLALILQYDHCMHHTLQTGIIVYKPRFFYSPVNK